MVEKSRPSLVALSFIKPGSSYLYLEAEMPNVFSEAVARLVVWALVGKKTEAEASANTHINALAPLFDPE